jgi:hypothetical protein
MKRVLLPPFILLCLCACAQAQLWSGIIDPSRATNWATNGVGANIVNRTTQYGSTIAACNDSSPANACSGSINSAIQSSAAANDYVLLGPGTFTLNNCLTFTQPNVTLRGSGTLSTILVFTGSTLCGGSTGIANIHAIDSTAYYQGSAAVQPGGSNACSWTAGYTRGATQITLNSCGSTPPANQFILLDQANDTTDNGGDFVCDNNGTTSGFYCNQSDETPLWGRTISNVDHSQVEAVQITSIVSGSGKGPYVVNISPGLLANNWRAGQNPGAWWPGQIAGIGIESMTVDGNASPEQTGIQFYDCYSCWIKGVRSVGEGTRNHFWFYQGMRNTLRDSYVYGNRNYTDMSYGIEFLFNSDDLVENNIFDTATAPDIGGQISGTVYAYNYETGNTFITPPTWMSGSSFGHDTGLHMNLYEGNIGNSLGCDDVHGTSGLNTVFRVQLHGSQVGKTQNTQPVTMNSYCRGENFIGNVLGTSGYDTQYEVYPPSGGSTSACYATIWNLGWNGSNCGLNGGSGVLDDTVVRSTLLRWGNCDSVSGFTSCQFNSSEVPTTAAAYINANAVPSSHTLPNSFYLSAQPAFWATPYGTPAFPPIGPDVSGGSVPNVGGHVNMIPAGLCYQNTSVDPAYQVVNTVTGASWSGGTATLNVTNGLAAGFEVIVTGITPSGYNGTVLVLTASSSQITYALASNPGSYSSGGQVSSNNVLLFNANTCYGSDPAPPAAPTNLTAVVH